MLSYFYKRDEKTSAQQLCEDFGEFPPAPLQCVPPASDFVVVHMFGPGVWVNYWRRSAELLHALEAAPETVAPELVEALSSLRRVDDRTDPALRQIHIGHRYIFPRPFMRIFLMSMFRRADKRRTRVLGHVLPITQYDRQITLFTRANSNVGPEDPILTHEHIHFLQHQDTIPCSKYLYEPNRILKEHWAQERYVLYLLERLEVEARLHELVLSYYRVRQVLPQTVDAFLGLLADWEEIGEYLALVTESAGLKMQGTGPTFAPRSVEFGSQLGILLTALKDSDTTRRFVCEVLPVMYGNLLRYYGDANASTCFLLQIPRPNLYDRLYGSRA